MKTKLILITISTLVIIAACHSSKKATTSTASTTPAVATTPTVSATPTPSVSEEAALQNLLFLQKNQPTGVNPPTDAEVNALKAQYQDVTLAKLQEGYALYAKGPCIKCHGAVNVYHIPPHRLNAIINDMAFRAELSPSQKDAVYKYVLATKATEPK